MTRKNIFTWLLTALCLSMVLACAAAEEAVDAAKDCKLTVTVHQNTCKRMLNEQIDRYWEGGDSTLTVTLPEGQKAQGVMLTFFGDVPTVQAADMDGHTLALWQEGYYTAWIPFNAPVRAFSLRAIDDVPLNICRLRVLTEGELPDWVQQWERLDGKADLLLIATHPDDDILWFGGLLPTYAGELRKKVMVAYMVGGRNRTRRIELLDALWHCGVRYYPEIGRFPDTGATSQASTLSAWGGEEAIVGHVAALIRKWQPLVVVTQDINGEYGHVHHCVTVKAVIQAATEGSMDAACDPESAAMYGLYAPEKLYIHLYKENQLEMDWQAPLAAFGGKTALTVAKEAFACHVSQQAGRYRVTDSGRYNSALLGLYWTRVGLDENKDDLLEHTTPREDEQL